MNEHANKREEIYWGSMNEALEDAFVSPVVFLPGKLANRWAIHLREYFTN
jgi:hypothetical protein